MPNIIKLLKDEIQRIARKEIKQAIEPLKKSTLVLKKALAQDKMKLAALEREVKRALPKQSADISVKESCELRITGKQVKSLRGRLGISQAQLGKLIGVSNQIITVWESKPSRLHIRKDDVRKALAELKGMKKAQVQDRIN